MYLIPKDDNNEVQLSDPKNLDPLDVMKEISKGNTDRKDISIFVDSKLSENQMKMFVIAQAKRELQKVIKFSEMLDKVQNRFEERIVNNLVAVPDYELPKIMTMLMDCIDRSNNLIGSIIKDKDLLQLLVIDNSKNLTVNNSIEGSVEGEIGSPMMDVSSRRKVINAVKYVLGNMDKIIEESSNKNVEQ